ncbi:MAG: ABC transporter, permease protein 1 (cluster 1, maltose/g3p/polyamine/iron), partial [uncultured Friedmanniella sp.]
GRPHPRAAHRRPPTTTRHQRPEDAEVQQARGDRRLPLHLPLDHRLPGLHPRRDGLQPLHLLQLLQPGEEHDPPRRAGELPGADRRPQGRALAEEHPVLRGHGGAAGDRLRAAAGRSAEQGQPGRGDLPHALLPAEDDALGGHRGRVLPAAERQHGRDQPGPGAAGDPGPAVADRPVVGEALDRADDAVGRQRHHGDLPGRPQERAARALRGRLAGRRRPGPAVLHHHGADDLERDLLQRHRAHHRGPAGVRPGLPAVLARPEQRLAGVVAVLRHLPLPAGLPHLRLRVRRGDGLAPVRDHHDHHGHPDPLRQPLRLLRGRPGL